MFAGKSHKAEQELPEGIRKPRDVRHPAAERPPVTRRKQYWWPSAVAQLRDEASKAKRFPPGRNPHGMGAVDLDDPAGSLPGPLSVNVKDVKRVRELVRHFHAPFALWLKFAIQALQSLASHDGSFLPSGVLVRQFLALVIEFGLVVIDVKKVPRHWK